MGYGEFFRVLQNGDDVALRRDIYELSLATRTALGTEEILLELLEQAGVDRRYLAVRREAGRLWVSAYIRSLSVAQGVRRKLRSLRLKGVVCRCATVRQSHWAGIFKKQVKPFTLSSSFDVVPLHAQKSYRRGRRQPVILDVGLSFGTGLHETTRLTVALIESCRGRFQSFLDVGTGTGILSIVAFKCGATKVHAVDADPDSLRAARANLRVNQLTFSRSATVDFGKWKNRQRYDLVAANLLTEDLITFRRKLVARVRLHKYLAVSGISLENLDRLESAFEELPLNRLALRRGRQWAAVLYQRLPTTS